MIAALELFLAPVAVAFAFIAAACAFWRYKLRKIIRAEERFVQDINSRRAA